MNLWFNYTVKIYPVIALAGTAALSTPASAVIPIVILAVYLFFWRWPINYRIRLTVHYFVYFSVPLLFSISLAVYLSILTALPLLLLLENSIKEAARSSGYLKDVAQKRRPTSLFLGMCVVAVLTALFGFLSNSMVLTGVSVLALLSLGSLALLVLRKVPAIPVSVKLNTLRILAGTQIQVSISLIPVTCYGGKIFLESNDVWLQINPEVLPLGSKQVTVEFTLKPPLSGPSSVKLNGYAVDRWGLIQTQFTFEPLLLSVIPRASYAAWLANRYLNNVGAGTLPTLTGIQTLKQSRGKRSGIEYLNSRDYQPGDSYRNIDWKHSLRHNELMVKEYTESSSVPAILLINLVAGTAEEADSLAYRILTTAISLARENIPAVLASYNEKSIVMVTPQLSPRQMVQHALGVIENIKLKPNPLRYLKAQDINRLRDNIYALSRFSDEKTEKLLQLLQIEYDSVRATAEQCPVAEIIKKASVITGRSAAVVIISQRNHDAEALSLEALRLSRNGIPVISA